MAYRDYDGKVFHFEVKQCPDVDAAVEILSHLLETKVVAAP